MEIRIAETEDTEAVLGLLKGAAQWLQDQKIRQWSFLLSGGEDVEIKQAIIDQETYVMCDKGKVKATFTVYQEPSGWDRHIWDGEADGGVYLHRLAVHPASMGNGLGEKAVGWICTNFSGKPLRLDCVYENEKLNQYYQKIGFELKGVTDSHSRYEKAGVGK
jgi:GNAT superfamily N-acetyltransferase